MGFIFSFIIIYKKFGFFFKILKGKGGMDLFTFYFIFCFYSYRGEGGMGFIFSFLKYFYYL